MTRDTSPAGGMTTVYFLQAKDGGPVKIGFTKDVDRRLAELEATYDRPLNLLHSIPGGLKEERAIQERFSTYRIGRTEQFRPCPELLEFVGHPSLTKDDQDSVEAMTKKKGIPIQVWLSRHEYLYVRHSAKASQLSMSDYIKLKIDEALNMSGIIFDNSEPHTDPVTTSLSALDHHLLNLWWYLKEASTHPKDAGWMFSRFDATERESMIRHIEGFMMIAKKWISLTEEWTAFAVKRSEEYAKKHAGGEPQSDVEF